MLKTSQRWLGPNCTIVHLEQTCWYHLTLSGNCLPASSQEIDNYQYNTHIYIYINIHIHMPHTCHTSLWNNYNTHVITCIKIKKYIYLGTQKPIFFWSYGLDRFFWSLRFTVFWGYGFLGSRLASQQLLKFYLWNERSDGFSASADIQVSWLGSFLVGFSVSVCWVLSSKLCFSQVFLAITR